MNRSNPKHPDPDATSGVGGSPTDRGRVTDRLSQLWSPVRIPARPRRHSRRHSLFVTRTKRASMATAAALLLSLAIWPSLSQGFERLRAGVSRLDASQFRDLRMVNPRYAGTDRNQRPFTVMAESGRQVGGSDATVDDLVALDAPKADLLTNSGAWVVAASRTGIYQPEAHKLDLVGDVTLFHERGYSLKTTAARVDMQAGSAEGSSPVSGAGPTGTVDAQGFRVVDRGDTVVFIGHSTLITNSAHGSGK